MESVRIKQLKARYRLPVSQLDARQRLDALLREATGDALEAALEYLGIGGHEEICIRRIYAPVRLRLSQSDQTLIEQWSLALAEHIHQAVEEGDLSVVRYPSRLNGLLDLAAGVALRCLHRSWAWDQLGLTELGEEPSQREALSQLLRALEREPQFITPVLIQLARQQRLVALAQQLDEESWQCLAQASLQLAGGGWRIGAVAQALPPAAPGVGQGIALQAASLALLASSLLQRSQLAHTLMRSPHAFARPALALESLAALIIVESEPTLLRREQSWLNRLVCAMALELGAGLPALPGLGPFVVAGELYGETDKADEVNEVDEAGKVDEVNEVDEAGKVDEAERRSSPDESLRTTKGKGGDATAGEERIIPDEELYPPLANGGSPRLAETDTVETAQHSEPIEDYPIPLPGVGRVTEYGGLLYLLSLIDELALPDAIVDANCFAERPFHWVLHRLGSTLLPLSPTDPALIAFCGLGDVDELPWRDALPSSELERQWLEGAADALVQRLRERMDIEREKESRQGLLQRVCRRSAELHSEPGWLEVVFALDDISVEIRRAALDLDPGYLPWLGQVVRFRYE